MRSNRTPVSSAEVGGARRRGRWRRDVADARRRAMSRTLAARVVVFNQGHVIAQGKPEAVVKEEAVIEAYLGRGHRTWRK